MIKLTNVYKSYQKSKDILVDVSFNIEEGEFVFLVGKSGAGKSTILKLLYKAEMPTEGTVEMFNKDVSKMKTHILRKKIGVVFQDFEVSLLNNKTAYENVAYVLESQGQNPFKMKNQVDEALSKVGLLEVAKKFPNELSGGEKQRVAIARAIVNNPAILICDEPTGNLDNENAEEIMKYLNLLNEKGTTIIMTTHNSHILEQEKKRTIYLESGEIKNEKGMSQLKKPVVKEEKYEEIEKTKEVAMKKERRERILNTFSMERTEDKI